MAAVSVAIFNPQDPPLTVRGLVDEFHPYGTLRSVEVRNTDLAVVEFEDLRSALDAVLQLDGRHYWIVRPFALPHTSADNFRHFEHHERGRARGRGTGTGPGPGPAPAPAPGPGPGNPHRRGPGLGRNGCYRCREPGHTARDCRLLRRPGTRSSTPQQEP